MRVLFGEGSHWVGCKRALVELTFPHSLRCFAFLSRYSVLCGENSADALAYLHPLNSVHRDLKTENVPLTDQFIKDIKLAPTLVWPGTTSLLDKATRWSSMTHSTIGKRAWVLYTTWLQRFPLATTPKNPMCSLLASSSTK